MNGDSIVIHPNRSRLLGFALACLAFFLFPVLWVVNSWQASRYLDGDLVAAYLIIPLSGWGIYWAFEKALSTGPLLVVDEQGIVPTDYGLIRWDEVADVFVCEHMSQPIFCIRLKNLETLQARLGPWPSTLLGMNAGWGFGHINISGWMLPYSPHNLVHHIRVRFWTGDVEGRHPDSRSPE